MAAQTVSGPSNGVAYIFYIGLRSQADSTIFKNTPTIAAGDFKVSIDGGALNNLTTLPTNTPASSAMVKISLSASEMTGDNITVVCIDAAGAEWFSEIINIQTIPAPTTAGVPDVNATKINNVATTSVTTINANVGTTQPENFTGTGASALVKVDIVDIAGAAVATGTAQLGVNVVNFGGSAGTFASGRPEVNTTHFRGTASVGAVGYVGIDWSAVNAPTSSVGLTNTTFSATQVVASVSGAVGSVTGAVGSVTGAVGSVAGNVGGNVVGAVASVTAAVSITGDLSATMKASVTTACSASTPVATLSGDLTATMKTSVTTACTASTPTAAAVTGAVGSVTATVNADAKKINGVTVIGTGVAGDLWRA